jgi:hypothetical protein
VDTPTSADNEIVPNVRIFTVETDGASVRVDIYGGDDALCGSVGYHFPNARQRSRNVTTLRRWCASGTPLTLVRRQGIVTLLDEAGVLDELLSD